MKSRHIMWLVSALVALGGCESSAVEGLKGRWRGQIQCAVDRSDVQMGLEVANDRITGTAIIRTKELNSDWQVDGFQQSLTRSTHCRDDTCVTDDDCLGRGDGTCNQHGICTPCTEQESWRRVTLTLQDADLTSKDPVMLLERSGDERLSGTIENFCSDEGLLTPHVQLDKDPG